MSLSILCPCHISPGKGPPKAGLQETCDRLVEEAQDLLAGGFANADDESGEQKGRASPPAADLELQAGAALLRTKPRCRAIDDLADPQHEQGAGGGSRPQGTELTAVALDGVAASAVAAKGCFLQGSMPKGAGSAQAALRAAKQQHAARGQMPACKAPSGAAAVSCKLKPGADAALAELGEVLHGEGRRLTRGMAHTLGGWGQPEAAQATVHASAQAQVAKVPGGQKAPRAQAGQGQHRASKAPAAKQEQGAPKAQAIKVDLGAVKPGDRCRGSAAKAGFTSAKAAPAKAATSLKVTAGGRVTKAGGKRSSKASTVKQPAAAGAGAEAAAKEGRAEGVVHRKTKSPGPSASGTCINDCCDMMHWAEQKLCWVSTSICCELQGHIA